MTDVTDPAEIIAHLRTAGFRQGRSDAEMGQWTVPSATVSFYQTDDADWHIRILTGRGTILASLRHALIMLPDPEETARHEQLMMEAVERWNAAHPLPDDLPDYEPQPTDWSVTIGGNGPISLDTP
jgi:hypothetical protein